MQFLRQSTAATVELGQFVDSADGASAETALTISQADIRLSKNGGAFAQTANATGATHMENGYYSIPLDTTDTNTVGRLKVAVSESGALGVWADFQVLEEAVFDSLFAASAAGYQVPIWSSASATVSLSGTTVATTTTNTDMRGTDGANTTTPPTVGAIADAVLDEALSGHVTVGTLGKAVADIETDATAILADTGTDGVVVAAASKTGYSLTATTGLGNQTANITGNLSGSVGSVTGAVGSVTGNVGGNVTGSVGSLATQAKADVNAEVVDTLNTDTYAEPAQGAPGATISLAAKIGFLYKAWRNKSTQNATTYSLYNDDTTTVDHKASVSDDGTTATKGEVATGP